MERLPFTEAANRVKYALDIVDVVSRHVSLKKAGRNYSGLCPFHQEKTPSFNVNREKNLFKCFGCGEAGDALAFLMKVERKTYGEIIREMAADQGIEILAERKADGSDGSSDSADITKTILDLNQAIGTWFENQLDPPLGSDALNYLIQRGVDRESARKFGLGYALNGWEHGIRYLSQQFDTVRQNQSLLLTAGLALARNEGQGAYDRFRNRLMIPIRDHLGRLVAFGGRALSPEDNPKYLNSPETPVYIKSKVLYALYESRETIRQQRAAVVMEGYFDVISAHMAGITNAIATCGTALTEQHLRLLSRFGAETLYFCFDADEAGQRAAMQAIDLTLSTFPHNPMSMKVIIIPDGKDPDEFIRRQGGVAFSALLEKALSFTEFKLETALKGIALNTSEGRFTAANRLVPVLATIRQPILRHEMIRQYAQRIGTVEDALLAELKRYEQRMPGVQASPALFQGTSFQKNSVKKRNGYQKPGQFKRRQEERRPYISMDIPRHLTPAHVTAEHDLFALLFMNTESFALLWSVVRQCPMEHPQLEQLRQLVAEQLESPSCQTFASLDELVHAIDVALLDHVEQRALLSDLQYSAGMLYQRLNLVELAPASAQEKLMQEANTYVSILDEYRRQKSLKALNQHLKGLEGAEPELNEASPLALQYQLRDQLSHRLGSRVRRSKTNPQPGGDSGQ